MLLPGSSELLLIMGVALLLFGPKKLPQLGSAIGESIRNFRKGIKTPEEEKPEAKTVVSANQDAEVPRLAEKSCTHGDGHKHI